MVALLPPGTPPPDRSAGWDKGHGRIEWRQLEATAALTGYLTWPGAAQVCRIERRRRIRGEESVEVVHAITSLSPERADAARLLALSRARWEIENRLHRVRDVTPREDACRVRCSGYAPQALAACRNAVLTLLRGPGVGIVAGIEHFQEHRRHALGLVRYGRIG